jgi:hypothetical protein
VSATREFVLCGLHIPSIELIVFKVSALCVEYFIVLTFTCLFEVYLNTPFSNSEYIASNEV